MVERETPLSNGYRALKEILGTIVAWSLLVGMAFGLAYWAGNTELFLSHRIEYLEKQGLGDGAEAREIRGKLARLRVVEQLRACIELREKKIADLSTNDVEALRSCGVAVPFPATKPSN